ncbi:MAG: tRNA uridine-5-carboxymethylaminomethyl(34) synthesis GTPase MnmE [Bacillota bacterium]|nr:tRNA uridine-5-carboxymethylaminomethyl(34) synthesis GTPase MnmE [Bacillota bacterium]
MRLPTTTIAAFATAPGRSGIAVLRLSGPAAANIADRVFTAGRLPAEDFCEAPAADRLSSLEGYRALYGYVHRPDRPDEPIDEAIALRFVAPRSYTGEDTVEFSVHGSAAVRQLLLESVVAAGAEVAGPGDFTRRAVLHGRKDLVQAEAIADLIDATVSRSARAALDQLSGRLSAVLAELRETLYESLAALHLAIEFPEHDEATPDTAHAYDTARQVGAGLDRLIRTHRQGRLLREGLAVVLSGAPNAGKSSLFNALVGEMRAIVTAHAGTTRDRVEVELDLDGLAIRLSDTAGLRPDAGEIESLGIEQTRRALETADLAFWLLDAAAPVYPGPQDLSSFPQDLTVWPILAQSDRLDKSRLDTAVQETAERWERLTGRPAAPDGTGLLLTSVPENRGLDRLRQRILVYFESLGGRETELSVVVTNVRHAAALREARAWLRRIEDMEKQKLSADRALPADVLVSWLQAAADELAAIDGQLVDEEILDSLFSRFCVGK